MQQYNDGEMTLSALQDEMQEFFKNAIDVDLEPNKWIHGNEKSVVFQKVYSGNEKDCDIELTWDEIFALAWEEKQANECKQTHMMSDGEEHGTNYVGDI